MTNQVEKKIKDGKRIAVIRTSDRISFKSCRRKWDLMSHLRQNLEMRVTGDPLWLGSAMHYALEDYHGANKYGTPSKALQAYAAAYNKKMPKKLPEDWQELCKLGCDMMDYYLVWLTGRDPLQTYVVDGIKQVEVNVIIPVPIDLLRNAAEIRKQFDEVHYSMQFDRVHIDEHGALWLVEYKSAKIMSTTHFLTDPQVTTYMWGMRQIYPTRPIAGIVYQQHKKSLPKPGRELANGTISTNAQQATSHRAYRQSLIDKYKDVNKAPKDNIRFLNELARKEGEHHDDFIRRDFIHRNPKSAESAAQQILMEISDMLDPNLQIYPNPTRMCIQHCSLMGPCVSMDDGGDWKADLESETQPRTENYWEANHWRSALPDPAAFKGLNFIVNNQPKKD